MTGVLSAGLFLNFLNGNVFGYMLHAVEVLATELFFTISLKKRGRFLLRLIPFAVAYLVLSVVLGMVFERYFYYGRYMITFFLSIAVMCLCFDANIMDILFCIAAASATQNLSFSSGAFVVGLIGWDPLEITAASSIVQTVVYVTIQAIVLKICYKRNKDVQGAGSDRFIMVVLSLLLIVVIYVLQLDRQSLNYPDFLLWRSMFIGYDVLMLLLLFGMYDKNKLRRENEILDSLRVRSEKQYESDRRAMEMINIKCHDLKHQLIALRNMPAGSERDQVLNEMEEAVLIYDSIAKTGCSSLDVVLSGKYLLCERYNIKITYMVDGKLLDFMKSSDIYSLFGNALDNAIRAEREVNDEEKRIINLSVTSRGGGAFLRIFMENYCEDKLTFQNGLPVTTQSDAENHGFGMLSMRRIVESYGGVMSVELANNMFTVNITIPLRQARKAE